MSSQIFYLKHYSLLVMKKLCIFLAAAFFAVNVSASQGAMVLSGSLGLNMRNVSPEAGDGLTVTSFQISPNFLYFLSDRFAVGGQVGLSLQSASLDHIDTGTLFNIGVAGRYYFWQTQRFGVFAHATLDFGFANDHYQHPLVLPNASLNNSIMFGIAPGIQFFINDSWSVETHFAPVLSFIHLNSDVFILGGTTNVKTNDFNLNINPLQAEFAPLRVAVNFHF